MSVRHVSPRRADRQERLAEAAPGIGGQEERQRDAADIELKHRAVLVGLAERRGVERQRPDDATTART